MVSEQQIGAGLEKKIGVPSFISRFSGLTPFGFIRRKKFIKTALTTQKGERT